MANIELRGRINEFGKLEVELPEGLPQGDVKVVIEMGEKESTQSESLLGLWSNLGTAPSEEDIDEARREMWANFPRDDIA